MQISFTIGDVLETQADVLISSANPWLNLSGGVGGAILEATGPEIQAELHTYLKHNGKSAVAAGTVIPSRAGDLPFRHILHAVAIDPFYDSSTEVVRLTVERAFELAVQLGANSVSMPALATGYGPLSVTEFAEAIHPLLNDSRFQELVVSIVVRSDERMSELEPALWRQSDET